MSVAACWCIYIQDSEAHARIMEAEHWTKLINRISFYTWVFFFLNGYFSSVILMFSQGPMPHECMF